MGGSGALVWFLLTQFAFTPMYPQIERWRLSEYFMIRYVGLSVSALLSLLIDLKFLPITETQPLFPIFYGLNTSLSAAKLTQERKLWRERAVKELITKTKK